MLTHLDAQLFAPPVNPSGLVKGVDKCFDFVAGLSQPLDGFTELERSSGVLVQQPVSFLAAHPVPQSYPGGMAGWDRSKKWRLPAIGNAANQWQRARGLRKRPDVGRGAGIRDLSLRGHVAK